MQSISVYQSNAARLALLREACTEQKKTNDQMELKLLRLENQRMEALAVFKVHKAALEKILEEVEKNG